MTYSVKKGTTKPTEGACVHTLSAATASATLQDQSNDWP